MNFPIDKHTLFLTVAGSHAYGMDREDSDIDIRGIAIPPKEYFLGFHKRFEQFEGQFTLNVKQKKTIERIIGRKIGSDEKIDSCIYDIRKFFHLAAQCNPNMIELLFTNEDKHIVRSPVLDELFESKKLFLSTRANFRFRGYAFSQLKRIKTHRRWILNPIESQPRREDFGLPLRTVVSADQLEAAESLIKKKVDEWIFEQEEMTPELLSAVRLKTVETFKEVFSGLNIKDIVSDDGELDRNRLSNVAGNLLGYSSNFLELLYKERCYKTARNNWRNFKKWEKERNPKRAEMEKKFHYDGKNASHLIRLLSMSREILEKGQVVVCRPDAEQLLSIRDGILTYREIVEWAEQQDREIQEFYDSGKSPLPKSPDMNAIDKLCIRIIEKFFRT